MNERILITGASGFLGYHLIQAALHQGFEVYAAVRKNSPIEHLNKLPIHFVHLNYEDPLSIRQQLVDLQIHSVVHSAGITKAVKQEEYNHVNAQLSINLAKAVQEGVPTFKKLVFISSLAAVGPASDPTKAILETDEPKPVTAYGRSKLLAEQVLKKTGIPLVILRPTAIYGPRDKDIFIMIKTVSQGLDPYIGRIQQQLSFVHGRDVADLAMKAILNPQSGGIFHVTDGATYSRYRLSDITKKLLVKKAWRFHIPLPFVRCMAFVMEKVQGWRNKPAVLNREKLNELAAENWSCDVRKAQSELGFQPKYNLESGLEDTINWCRENKWL